MYELFFLPFQINYKPLFYRPWFVIAILILVFLCAVGIPPVDSWIWTHSSDAFRGWITFLALGPGGYTLFEADGGALADFAGSGEGSYYVLRGEENVRSAKPSDSEPTTPSGSALRSAEEGERARRPGLEVTPQKKK